MRTSRATIALAVGTAVLLAPAETAAATGESVGDRVMACRSGSAATELYSPAKWYVGVEKSWRCVGRHVYNGRLRRVVASPPGRVWAEMYIRWQSGRVTHKRMKLGKRYVYRGAHGVSIRACDAYGCSRWW
ncbi:hypothetical protein Arub01_46520 [Actinomadura rubrobrunea]|uniref:Secreted protein n=1 Tax=Actinomadura rubrobrunea TaxID=115335 RepID=A0A9W6UXR6_9ACTN|nr:hypothetical protein Arub01_46520 [Actinomadura rubrobrunea]